MKRLFIVLIATLTLSACGPSMEIMIMNKDTMGVRKALIEGFSDRAREDGLPYVVIADVYGDRATFMDS